MSPFIRTFPPIQYWVISNSQYRKLFAKSIQIKSFLQNWNVFYDEKFSNCMCKWIHTVWHCSGLSILGSQITSVACNPEVQMIWNRVSSYSICLTRRFLWRHDHQNLFIFFSIQRQLRHAVVVLFISLPQNLASLACNFNCVPLCDDCRSYYSLIVMPISVMCYKWIYLYCTPICD